MLEPIQFSSERGRVTGRVVASPRAVYGPRASLWRNAAVALMAVAVAGCGTSGTPGGADAVGDVSLDSGGEPGDLGATDTGGVGDTSGDADGDGAAADGTAEDGTAEDGTAEDGTAVDDTAAADTAVDGGPPGDGQPSDDTPAPDGGAPDAVQADADPLDGSGPDGAGPGDTGPDDAGSDAANPDAGGPDIGSPDAGVPDDSGGSDGSGPPDVVDPGPDPAPPEGLDIHRQGGRLVGTVLALSRTDRTLWIGTRPLATPPALDTMRGGLGRLDLDTGAFHRFEAELPTVLWDDGFAPVEGPAPTARVAGGPERHLAVTHDGLLEIVGDSVAHVPLLLPGGQAVVARDLAFHDDGEVAWAWVSSSERVLRLDPESLSVLDVTDLGPGGLGEVVVDPATGAAFVARFAEGQPSSVVRVSQAGAVSELFPGQQGTPAGLVGGLVWSVADAAAFVAVAAWEPTDGGVLRWDGVDAATVALEGQLALAANGELAAFGPQVLALDEEHHVLVVGGRLSVDILGASKGGGIAYVDLDSVGPIGAEQLGGVAPWETPFIAHHVDDLAYDPITHRTIVALSSLCSEKKLRRLGVYSLSFTGGKPGVRIERPVLSGVRALEEVDGQTWVGLRDEHLGMQCSGYTVQSGLGVVRANGAAELKPLSGETVSPLPGIREMAVRTPQAMAVATFGDVLFLGGVDGGVGVNPAIEFNMSLDMEALVLADPHTLWVGGRTSHANGEPAQLENIGPHGAARVLLDDQGQMAGFTHFVAASNKDKDVKGLPSSSVRDIAVEPSGAALLACGAERVRSVYDRADEPWFVDQAGQTHPGGVARVVGEVIDIISGPETTPDAWAVGVDAAGTIVIGDAVTGLWKVGESGPEPWDPGVPVPEGSIPLTFWFADNGVDLAVGYTTGLAIRMGESEGFIGGTGWVWDLQLRGGVLLAGTDEGLLRIGPAGVEELPLEAAPAGLPPAFQSIPLGPGPP